MNNTAIWQKIRFDALGMTLFLTFIAVDFYPHPRLGKSLTERSFLTIKAALTGNTAPSAEKNSSPAILQSNLGPSQETLNTN